MRMSNWLPVFDQGNPTGDIPQGRELYVGTVYGPIKAELTQLRSEDMVKRLSSGRFEVAIVGSVDVEEFFSNRFVELARLPLGRKWHTSRSRLDLAALETSTINTTRELPEGSVVYAEREKIVTGHLEASDKSVRVMDRHADEQEFKKAIAATGEIGIISILSGGGAQLDKRNPDAAFVAMVNEEGSTVLDYKLKVLDTIRPIDTLIISTQDAMANGYAREYITRFASEMEAQFVRAKEYEQHIGTERL